MGLQAPCGLDSQMQEEGIIRRTPEAFRAVFKTLARQKESNILEGHLMVDHVHMLISIPPKYGVSQVVGFIKGKSAIHMPGPSRGEKGTLQATTFGPEAILYQQSAETKRSFGNTSRNKRLKTDALTNFKCFERVATL